MNRKVFLVLSRESWNNTKIVLFIFVLLLNLLSHKWFWKRISLHFMLLQMTNIKLSWLVFVVLKKGSLDEFNDGGRSCERIHCGSWTSCKIYQELCCWRACLWHSIVKKTIMTFETSCSWRGLLIIFLQHKLKHILYSSLLNTLTSSLLHISGTFFRRRLFCVFSLKWVRKTLFLI